MDMSKMGTFSPVNPLQFVNSRTTFEEAFAILAALEPPAPEPTAPEKPAEDDPDKTGIEDQGDNLDALRTALGNLQTDYNTMADVLSKVFEENARQNLQGLKDVASAAVTDYKSAYDLTTFYTKEWFSRLFFPMDDKIDFARHLLDLVTPYATNNTTAWSLMIDNNPDILDYISVPKRDT